LLKILSQPGSTLQAGFFYWYRKDRSISHGKEEEEKTFLPRTNTEISRSRNTDKTEAEELATDEHGKTRKKTEAETRIRSRSKELLPQRRQVRQERKTMSDAS